MKTVRYPGTDQDIEYDETAPCLMCGLPVVSASMGGTVICPWCDCGRPREEAGRLYFQYRGQGIHPKAIEHYGIELAKSADPEWIKPHLEGPECEEWSDRWTNKCGGPHQLPPNPEALKEMMIQSEEDGFYDENV